MGMEMELRQQPMEEQQVLDPKETLMDVHLMQVLQSLPLQQKG